MFYVAIPSQRTREQPIHLPPAVTSISYQKVFSLPMATFPLVTGKVLPVRLP